MNADKHNARVKLSLQRRAMESLYWTTLAQLRQLIDESYHARHHTFEVAALPLIEKMRELQEIADTLERWPKEPT